MKEKCKSEEHCCHCCCEEEHYHNEHGENSHGCACGHDHSHSKNDIYRIIFGTIFFAAGLVAEYFFDLNKNIVLAVYILGYLSVGYEVLVNAFKNIFRGRMLDENFLMSVSSIAAFFIGSHSEAVAVMLFYNIGEYFQGLAVKKSRKSISDLMDICADTATVVRDGGNVEALCEDVAVGDIILIKAGDKVPLDAVVVKGKSELDTSALTGESRPLRVFEGSYILSGSINKSGSIEARVEKKFSESTASKIMKMVESAADKKAPAENFITAFSKMYTPVVVILAILIAVLPSLIFGGWSEWIRRGCVFLVISCPCALVISIPLTFFGGIGAASKKGILVKGGNYLEALSKVDTVVFDKTGTLTKGEFGVSKIIPKTGVLESSVLKAAATAEQISNHPIAMSILKAAKDFGELPEVLESLDDPGLGIAVKTDDGNFLVGSEELFLRLNLDYEKYTGFETVVYVSRDKEYLGAIVLSDIIKPDAKEAIFELKKAGVKKCVMLTGDIKSVAENVAENIGISEFYAGLLPEEKVAHLERIKKESDAKVVFAGDGINDAPVLAISDVGIAMGGIGSDAAIEAADCVIMNDEVEKIAQAINLAKKTKKIVTENIAFSLFVKLAFLVLGAFGIAGMWEAVFGDVGVMLIAVLNATRILKD